MLSDVPARPGQSLDLLLTRHEHQDVMGRRRLLSTENTPVLGRIITGFISTVVEESLSVYLMDLEDRDERSLQVVGLGLLGVVDLNGMLSALQVENGRLVEVFGEQIHIHGGGHDYDLRILSKDGRCMLAFG